MWIDIKRGFRWFLTVAAAVIILSFLLGVIGVLTKDKPEMVSVSPHDTLSFVFHMDFEEMEEMFSKDVKTATDEEILEAMARFRGYREEGLKSAEELIRKAEMETDASNTAGASGAG